MDSPWDQTRVDAYIARLTRDTHATLDRHGYWPSHPGDSDTHAPRPVPSLYHGTAGIVWALAELGAPTPRAARLLRDAVAQSLAMRESGGPDYRRGLLLAVTGIHLVAALLTHSPDDADTLHALVRENRDNPVREFMWGAPGTLLAAKVMFDATHERRWRDAFRESAQALFDSRLPATTASIMAWRQDLYGYPGVHLGAVHGFAGNVAPIVVGWDLLSPAEFERWREVAMATTRATAIREDGLANWPQSIEGGRPGRAELLTQICHGAPGMVVALGELADGSDARFDDVMLAGGELTWQAGPLAKGPGLCHGTAGNGYAFLRLHKQTRDPRWLDRARAFAMHALLQSEAARAAHGDWRYSLWTGDLGVALYLRACTTADPRFPTFGYA